MTINRQNKFLKELQKNIPDFNIKYKNQSLFIKSISYILFFNKKFMTDYTTTIGNTVYFTSKEYIENNPKGAIILLAHEFVHALDRKNNIMFQFNYLMPQILSPIFLIAFFILSGWCSFIFLLLSVLCLLPIIPAFYRSAYELRGYKMSLFINSEIIKEENSYVDYNLSLKQMAEDINNEFINSSYYWMNRSGVITELTDTITKIKTDDIVKDDMVYNIVREAFKNSK